MSLWSDYLTSGQRTISKWPHYFPIYEKHFARFRNRPCRLLEIGVDRGGSLRLWKRWLGPLAKIIGVDINPECAKHAEPQVEVLIGAQADPEFLARVLALGIPDIIIDDGSHRQLDVLKSFEFLYQRMSSSGVYVIEDIHASYWPEFDGGLRRPGATIEWCKELIDDLNGHWSNEVSSLTLITQSMHFYDSLVVFEKGEHPMPAVPPTMQLQRRTDANQ